MALTRVKVVKGRETVEIRSFCFIIVKNDAVAWKINEKLDWQSTGTAVHAVIGVKYEW